MEPMLERLERAEKMLPALLKNARDWHSLDVNYHPPRVERLWRPWEDCRLYLHRIHPCLPNQALFHTHPWPSAIKVLSGTYEMGLGLGDRILYCRSISQGLFAYEMMQPEAKHYVRPIGDVSYSLMLTGPPWEKPAVTATSLSLGPLSEEEVKSLLGWFRKRYR